jgi:EpsI family protein
MSKRVFVLVGCFMLASFLIAKSTKTEAIPLRMPLSALPNQIGAWKSLGDSPLDARVESILGVSDYVNRTYDRNGWLGLYIGFYESQRQGSTIHSPLNCLPGSGWNPVRRSYLTIPVSRVPGEPPTDIQVNRIVIEKGLDKEFVLYWYQAHGRVVASEYWGKFYSVFDAMRINRTDAALVRVITPIAGTANQTEEAAEGAATDFVKLIFPTLSRHLPD